MSAWWGAGQCSQGIHLREHARPQPIALAALREAVAHYSAFLERRGQGQRVWVYLKHVWDLREDRVADPMGATG